MLGLDLNILFSEYFSFSFATSGISAFIGLVFGAIGVFISIYSVKFNTEKKFISYIIIDFFLDGYEECLLDIDGETHSHLRRITHSLLIIKNGGNRPLSPNDFTGEISFKGNILGYGGRFISSEVLKHNTPKNNIKISQKNKDVLDISLGFLRQSEFIAIVVKHTFLDCCLSFDASTTHSAYAQKTFLAEFIMLIRKFLNITLIIALASYIFLFCKSYYYCFVSI